MHERSPFAFPSEEAELYDRQIRLWGMHSQEILCQSKALFLGFGSTQAEICKNITLAGMNYVCIIDWVTVQPQNAVSHLFLNLNTSVGLNRALASKEGILELNPFLQIDTVAVSENTTEILNCLKKQTNQISFDIVVASGLNYQTLCEANKICRYIEDEYELSRPRKRKKKQTSFIIVECLGMQSFVFFDITNQLYTTPASKPSGLTEHLDYVDFESFLNTTRVGSEVSNIYWIIRGIYNMEKSMQRMVRLGDDLSQLEFELQQTRENTNFCSVAEFIKYRNCEINPICAIIGGLVGQEIIKILVDATVPPIQNFYYFEAITGKDRIDKIGCI
ncbi:SUMO-activating enzyme subunit 1-like [Schistocerca gregaria]|uniref:SUMO-activating enzyme subunit 1-like n=1 Tax=Schistocerca gregaria TaxID=7010 RepID=UPI00211EB5D7|nr:SUMO-activating enzyme subunit 1-like [Schistocerca gregaria]